MLIAEVKRSWAEHHIRPPVCSPVPVSRKPKQFSEHVCRSAWSRHLIISSSHHLIFLSHDTKKVESGPSICISATCSSRAMYRYCTVPETEHNLPTARIRRFELESSREDIHWPERPNLAGTVRTLGLLWRTAPLKSRPCCTSSRNRWREYWSLRPRYFAIEGEEKDGIWFRSSVCTD